MEYFIKNKKSKTLTLNRVESKQLEKTKQNKQANKKIETTQVANNSY